MSEKQDERVFSNYEEVIQDFYEPEDVQYVEEMEGYNEESEQSLEEFSQDLMEMDEATLPDGVFLAEITDVEIVPYKMAKGSKVCVEFSIPGHETDFFEFEKPDPPLTGDEELIQFCGKVGVSWTNLGELEGECVPLEPEPGDGECHVVLKEDSDEDSEDSERDSEEFVTGAIGDGGGTQVDTTGLGLNPWFGGSESNYSFMFTALTHLLTASLTLSFYIYVQIETARFSLTILFLLLFTLVVSLLSEKTKRL